MACFPRRSFLGGIGEIHNDLELLDKCCQEEKKEYASYPQVWLNLV